MRSLLITSDGATIICDPEAGQSFTGLGLALAERERRRVGFHFPFTAPASSVASDGKPSTLSLDAKRAKNEGLQAFVGQSAQAEHSQAQLRQAVPHSWSRQEADARFELECG